MADTPKTTTAEDLIEAGLYDAARFYGADDDKFNGSAADTIIGGGEGNDDITGGAGDDLLLGEDGDDVLTYVMADNVGATDLYDGGAGFDTVRIVLTADEFVQVHKELMELHDWVGGNNVAEETDDPLSQASWKADVPENDVFETSFGLSLRNFENLELVVDGKVVSLSDPWYENMRDTYGPNGDGDYTGLCIDDIVRGTNGDNVIATEAGNDKVWAGGGHDEVYGADGNDQIWAGAGDDVVYGGAGTDTIKGGAGDDVLQGGEANDILDGGSGNDVLTGDEGDDCLIGGEGDDLFVFADGHGNDVIKDFDDFLDQDKLDFSDLSTINDMDDVWANIHQDGDDVVIETSDTSQIVLQGWNVSGVSADDFVF